MSSADFFKINFFEKFLRECHLSVKQLNTDQARHFVVPDLGSNCLRKLSADDTIFFKINVFKNLFLNTISVFVILSGLIWVQTVCKEYKQTTLAAKGVFNHAFQLGQMSCLFVLLLYVPSQQLWSWRDGQFTLPRFFLGKLEQAVNQYFVHILSLVTDNNPSWMIQ